MCERYRPAASCTPGPGPQPHQAGPGLVSNSLPASVFTSSSPASIMLPKGFLYTGQISPVVSVAQWVGASSHNQRVSDLIPSQGTYLGCGFDPQSGHVQSLVRACTGGNPSMLLSCTEVSLSPFLSKSNEKMSLGKI